MPLEHLNNVDNVREAKRFVSHAKSKLRKKIERGKVNDSFGRKEIRRFRKTFNYNNKEILEVMKDFINWCEERRE